MIGKSFNLFYVVEKSTSLHLAEYQVRKQPTICPFCLGKKNAIKILAKGSKLKEKIQSN